MSSNASEMRLLCPRASARNRCLLLAVLSVALPLVLLLRLRCAEQAGPPAVTLLPVRGPVEASVGRLDSSASYTAHTFLVVGSRWRALAGRPATIATHCSLDQLHWLAKTASSWTGPISVALFAPGAEFHFAACYIAYLRRCHPPVMEQVSFHVVSPVDWPARLLDDACQWLPADCSREPRAVLSEVSRRRDNTSGSWLEALAYPQNVLRNLARATSPTRHVLTTDVDMVFPSAELALQLEGFLRGQRDCSLCAYVLPVYEVAAEVGATPANKTELLSLVAAGRARRFHVKVFPENQRLSDLARWENMLPATSASVAVAYTVHDYQFWYEPVYVSDRTVPPYDERFVGYGTTRNTQVYEMFLAGWTFKVLDNAFLVHWGLQTLATYSKWRLRQQHDNLRRFVGFVREMAVRYDKDPLDLLQKFPKMNARLRVVPTSPKKTTQKP